MAIEWIGGAVTASRVSGPVVAAAAGWRANHRSSVRLDHLRRIEEIRDDKSARAALYDDCVGLIEETTNLGKSASAALHRSGDK